MLIAKDPSYRLHKASRRAVVTINGRHHYLAPAGAHGYILSPLRGYKSRRRKRRPWARAECFDISPSKELFVADARTDG